jgi:hypothetical protein
MTGKEIGKRRQKETKLGGSEKHNDRLDFDKEKGALKMNSNIPFYTSVTHATTRRKEKGKQFS